MEQTSILLVYTTIHYHTDTGGAGTQSRAYINYTFLQPQRGDT